MKKAAMLVLGVIAASGCTTRVADMTVGSTKNYDINRGQFVKGDRVTGTDTVPVLLGPLGVPNVKTAMDEAIETNRCAVGLTDVVISYLNHHFIVGSIGYRVEGDLILDTTLPGCATPTQQARLAQ